MCDALTIRPFDVADGEAVRSLFVRVNEVLAPPHLRSAFEAYVARSLVQEINRIPAYYGERHGGFWVATCSKGDDVHYLAGMFGLERADGASVELRRMYVNLGMQRRGIARRLLAHAEIEAVRLGYRCMVLSTSELQTAALAFYRSAGFVLVREEIATDGSNNKTIGADVRRFHFTKELTTTR